LSGAPIRVLIVDDHAVVREGLRTFLELQDGIEVVGEAANGEEALDAVTQRRPDVVVMDLVMPKLDGVGAMRELQRRGRAPRVLVLTSFLDDERLMPAIEAGAAGYLLKNVDPAELARAVRAAHAGEALLDPSVAARLVERIAGQLTERPPAAGVVWDGVAEDYGLRSIWIESRTACCAARSLADVPAKWNASMTTRSPCTSTMYRSKTCPSEKP